MANDCLDLIPLTSRRQCLALIAAAASSGPLLGRPPNPIRAIAFDAFVLFSPHTIVTRAHDLVGDKADALVAAASAKLFSYTWYYTSAGRYVGFDELAADAFNTAAQSLGLALTGVELDRLVSGYGSLELWPDVIGALQTLRRHNIRLALLSNLSDQALRANVRANQIEELLEFVLSTDRAQRYKPSPEAYGTAVRAFEIPRAQIGFAASASWDASGATWFGFPSVWVNRNGLPPERAHAIPALVSSGMGGVLQLAGVQPA